MAEHNPKDITQFTHDFIKELCQHAGFDLDAEIKLSRGALIINFVGPDAEPLLLRGGFYNRDLIDAIQSVLQRAVHNRFEGAVRAISIDVDDYRERRIGELEEAAQAVADKLSNSPIQHMEIYGMSSIDRRAMHRHLSEEGLNTESDGYGVLRRLIIQSSGGDAKRS